MTAPRRAASARRSKADKASAAASIEQPALPGIEPSNARAGASRTPAAAPENSASPVDPSVFDGQYRIKLESFEGPLDLLLHLIQQHELDILDIPVSFITEKYLEYLKLMQVLSIEIASEYLVMAATLVHIKSKMLLPVAPAGQEDGMPQEEEEDPRAELVRRLLEYQKYKAAAAELADRGTLGRDIFPRGIEEAEAPGPAEFAKIEVFDLLGAFEKILKRTKVKIDHEVVFDRISITDRIVELTDKLAGRRAVRFEWLFLDSPTRGPATRFDLVITFLAMLEMCRMKLLRVYQTGPLAPIYMGLVEGEVELTDEDREAADRSAEETLAAHPEVTEQAEEAPPEPAPAAETPAETAVDAEESAQLELPFEGDSEEEGVLEETPLPVAAVASVEDETASLPDEAEPVPEETASLPFDAEDGILEETPAPIAAVVSVEPVEPVDQADPVEQEDPVEQADPIEQASLEELNLAERGEVSIDEEASREDGAAQGVSEEAESEEVPDDG